MTVARHRGQPDDAGARAVAVDEGVVIGADVVVGVVIPAGGADAKTLVTLIDHVQLGQQVEAGGNGVAGILEVVVTIVVVRGGEHAVVGTLGTHAVVELAGVVEADRPILAVRVDLDGLGGWHKGGHDGGGQQAEAKGAAAMTRLLVIHYSLSECCRRFVIFVAVSVGFFMALTGAFRRIWQAGHWPVASPLFRLSECALCS
ncbi:hypothetical protein D3C85_1132450 [compost metagenome]